MMRWIRRMPAPSRLLEAARLVLVAAPTLVRMRIVLDRDGFVAARTRACVSGGRKRTSSLSPATTAYIVQRLASVAPKKLNCLPRSLTLWAMVTSYGYEPELKIGAAPRSGEKAELEAHAWVELESQPLGKSVERYVVLPLDARHPNRSAATR